MLNWATDCPKNSRVVFLNMLNLFSSYENVKILEVGTYCGTSIATMLNYLPNSVDYLMKL